MSSSGRSGAQPDLCERECEVWIPYSSPHCEIPAPLRLERRTHAKSRGNNMATTEDVDCPSDGRGMRALADIIRSGEFVVFVTGSGISAPSGIPTFRGEDNSVWASYVTDWGTRERFLEDPRAWWDNFWLPAHVSCDPGTVNLRRYHPNAAHIAVAEIGRERPNVCIVTQNIDSLHQRGGLPPAQLVEVHGRASLLKCVSPGCRFAEIESIPATELRLQRVSAEAAMTVHGRPSAAAPNAEAAQGHANEQGSTSEHASSSAAVAARAESAAGALKLLELPRCPACSKPSLPQALLFDEMYESHAFYSYRKVVRWFKRASAFVFIGTSFSVNVTLEALDIAEQQGARVFDFNTRPEAVLPGAVHIIGDSTVSLPLLARRVRDVEAPVHGVREWHEPRGRLAHGPLVGTSGGAGGASGGADAGSKRKRHGSTAGKGRAATSRAKGKRAAGRKPAPAEAVADDPTPQQLWVCCDACLKWRRIPSAVEQASLGAQWVCADNVWDPELRSCDAPEES